ncbi:MAG: hypothetical protein KGI69_00860 [Patescibacteria group bacterium]|nr:hypothetical protein [Patescibacteria group bacterium]
MDDKKKKTAEAVGGTAAIAALAVVVASWHQIVAYLSSLSAPLRAPLEKLDWAHFLANVDATIYFMIGLSIPISLFFLIGIIYCVERLKVIRKKEAEKHDVKVEPAFEAAKGGGDRDLAAHWEKVQSMLGSQNPNDWKQAILEADTMLDMILDGLGYRGESIGEKLKRAEPGEFKAVQDAWDAHKVRNQIAHEAGFQLTHHEANETIQRYRRVFEEFYYI